MKQYILLLLLGCICIQTYAIAPEYSEWNQSEMNKANTAANTSLSEQEQLVYLYCNLARMDGAKFARTYVVDYYKDKTPSKYYYSTLLSDLQKVYNYPVLLPLDELHRAAAYHAADMGRLGLRGHNSSDGTSFDNRISRYLNVKGVGENCDYGYNRAIDIVMHLLLDEDVPSLGHRINILRKEYAFMGVAIDSHKKYTYNCVMDFAISDGKYHPVQRTYASKPTTTQTGSSSQKTYNNPTTSTSHSSYYSSSAEYSRSTTVRERFYDYSGRSHITYVDFGYRFAFSDYSHNVALGLFSFRVGMFGMSLLDFEMGVAPLSHSFGYSPTMQLYIPIGKCVAFSMYGGVSVDITKLWGFMNKNYIFDSDNFYVGVLGGISFDFYASRYVPISIFAEYRYPFKGVVIGQEQGMSIGTKIGIGR